MKRGQIWIFQTLVSFPVIAAVEKAVVANHLQAPLRCRSLMLLLLLLLHLFKRERQAWLVLLCLLCLLCQQQHELLLKHLLLRVWRGGLGRLAVLVVELILELLELLLVQ